LPRLERYQERNADATRRIAELEETLGADPEALQRAAAEIHREKGASCLGVLAPSCALGLVEPLTVFLSPRRQSAIERLAGVAVRRTRP
jgi:hypothetical protein